MNLPMKFGVTLDRIANAVKDRTISEKAMALLNTLKSIQIDIYVNDDGLVTGGHVVDTVQDSPNVAPVEKKPPTLIDVLSAYRKTKDVEIPELEAQISRLKKLQENRVIWIGRKLKQEGMDNFKKKGLAEVHYVTKDAATVTDREAFFTWVLENKKTDFLPMKVIKDQVVTMLEEEKKLPPGVEYKTFKEIVVKKA